MSRKSKKCHHTKLQVFQSIPQPSLRIHILDFLSDLHYKTFIGFIVNVESKTLVYKMIL